MNRRALLAVVPTVALAGCAARLGLADRVEIVRKSVHLEPTDGDEPIDAAVRRYDSEDGPYYDGDVHDALAEEIDESDPLVLSASLLEDLEMEFDTISCRIRACEPGTNDDCHRTTLVQEDFNEVEVGDVADIVFRDSGGLVSVHERRDSRE
ncbi:hypothetical protein SAMN04487967_1171 [Natronorubrum sediminis]|uniref:Uncharacterized protein n=1 Tax=Natronorubrum sediminis TaxID=640943 RepID=A0A1H6FQG4_9EURY|nr:hypothetical protein [Natronorubrum sediminis]SEH13137.1 hypothetical protein SAMN04487967_1171 [Natronorubrum sediminis]